MKTAGAALNREQWIALILGMTGLFSLITRLFPALLTGFPLNDGGMFLVMIRDLRLNGFQLPVYTSFNLMDIPYAYPPLGFYIAGLLGSLGISDLELLRWLPILFNLLSIPAFFLLAEALLGDAPRAVLATMIYALAPDSFTWQIMGGGLTRALGMLFLLLAQGQVLRMFRKGGWRDAALAALFCALAVLSHPEAGLAAASSCALLWVFFGRTRSGTAQAAVTAGLTVLLTAPWWRSVLATHGLNPFQNVMFSGQYSANPLKSLLGMLLPLDAWTGSFHLLVLGGLVWELTRRRFLLPLWLVLPYLVEPRSAPAYAYIPAALMSARLLTEALPAWAAAIRSRRGAQTDVTKPLQWLTLGLAFLWFLQSALFAFPLRNTSLRPPLPQEAMSWAAENTPRGSRFLLLTGNGDAMTDPLQDWFPALALRRSLTTLQGQEWTLGKEFFPRRRRLAALQACEDAACVEGWASTTGLEFTHLFVERNPKNERLPDSLSRDSRYVLLFENEEYLIYGR